jgi:phosphatidylserine/phosphatidylglycerophosphate/cardiolipin synthase-like enzyme
VSDITISGQVLNSDSMVGAPGLVVGAYDSGPFGDVLVANTTNYMDQYFSDYARTASDGTFEISIPGGTYDLTVRVLDTVKRVIVTVPVTEQGGTIDLGEINVTSADLGPSWLASDGAFPTVIQGNDVKLIVDNHDAWAQIVQAVANAETSINWMLFYLDIGLELMTFSPDVPLPVGEVQGQSLEDALKTAAEQRGVTVRLACNQLTTVMITNQPVIPLPYPAVTAGHVQSYFQNVANVEVRPVLTPAYTPIHTKFVVIDDSVAFVIGSPFVSDYYDDSSHLIDDARHGTFDSFLPDSRVIRVPTHDVSLQIKGSALEALNETFRLHWNFAAPPGGATLGPAAPASPEAANVGVQVVRSLAGNNRYDGFPHGETSILESYLRAIGQATKYIYLENQYFTCQEIADALVLRLKQHLTLQVIFLTNSKVDIPGYSNWQPQLIQHVLAELTPTESARIGFFTIWSEGMMNMASTPTHVCRNYIHSKVAVIDDCWATVGSANLDGDSLTTSDNAVRGGWWALGWDAGLRSYGIVEENRESETNIVILDGIPGAQTCGLAKALRQQLWAEHLFSCAPNVSPASGQLDTPPPGGWLDLWTTAAQQKLQGLKSVDSPAAPGRVLAIPYDRANPVIPKNIADPNVYLKRAGVDPSTLVVRQTFRRFDWSTGAWVDAWTGD